MGCTSSLHKIQRDFEQTRLKLDATVENLKSANETIQQLETKFNNANAELEATRAKLNEMQGYSMFNLPSMPQIPSMPSMFSSNQQNLEEQQSQQQQEVKYQDENQQNQMEQNKEIDSSYIFPNMNMPSFFTPSSKPTDNDNTDQTSSSSLSTPSFINDLFKSLKPDETSVKNNNDDSNKDYNFEEDASNENRSAEKINSIIKQKNDV